MTQWSSLQEAIFSAVEQGDTNIIVESVAGSGKTTTSVEAARRAHGTKVMLAFNKAIATELCARGANAKTFHSVPYGPVARWKEQNQVDTNKVRRVFRNLPGRDNFPYSKFCTRLVGLGRQSGIGCLIPDTENAWLEIVNHHNLEFDNAACELGRGLELASELLTACNEDYAFDFDDMLYLSVKEKLILPKYDWVFVDEAQDTNAIQREILRLMMHDTSTLVAVGDPNQSIYGFRGASADSMQLIEDEFNCVRLPLHISYRCPKSVVTYARTWVDHIEAAPDAKDGIVRHLKEWSLDIFEPGDLILCRTSRNLVALGFKLIREQIPARIEGQDIGDNLKALVKKMNAQNLDDLGARLIVWRDRESQKCLMNDEPEKADAVLDKAEALLSVIDGMPEDMRTIEQMVSVLDYLFQNTGPAVKLSTIHRAKGTEAKRVYWLNRSSCPAKWAKKDWQKQEEKNLCYVATTRAVEELIFIEDDGIRIEKRGEVA